MAGIAVGEAVSSAVEGSHASQMPVTRPWASCMRTSHRATGMHTRRAGAAAAADDGAEGKGKEEE